MHRQQVQVVQPYVGLQRTFVPSISGTYYFALRVNQPSLSPWYVAFDDFRFEPTPNCPMPTAGTALVTSPSKANLSWISGGASNYEVVFQLAGTGVPAMANDTGLNV